MPPRPRLPPPPEGSSTPPSSPSPAAACRAASALCTSRTPSRRARRAPRWTTTRWGAPAGRLVLASWWGALQTAAAPSRSCLCLPSACRRLTPSRARLPGLTPKQIEPGSRGIIVRLRTERGQRDPSEGRHFGGPGLGLHGRPPPGEVRAHGPPRAGPLEPAEPAKVLSDGNPVTPPFSSRPTTPDRREQAVRRGPHGARDRGAAAGPVQQVGARRRCPQRQP
jgi:hypothetical protein